MLANADEQDQHLTSFRVYVSSSPAYAETDECPGGPYLQWNGTWNYGTEIWCNLFGQYITIERDYNEYGVTEFGICEMAIFGNYDSLDVSAHKLESSYTYELGQRLEIVVSHIAFAGDIS